MPLRGKPVLILVATLLTATSASSQPPDLTYHTVAPCAVLDTRVAGGAFAANETRTYNVVGSGSLASQGGSPSGCGVPGFSNNIPQVQAVALNIVAINPTTAGHLLAYAAGTTTSASVLNFTTGVNIANTTPVAVAQSPGAGDFKITAGIASTHVLVTVVGYYSKAVQTVYVHPVPGDNTASGTRLINALAGITNASSTKRYVVKVEPGIYDIGSTGLQMKPYVDIEGSGEQATVIRGTGGPNFDITYGVVKLAGSSELRDLKVLCEGLPGTAAIGVFGSNVHGGLITNVTIESSSGDATWGLRHGGSLSLVVSDSRIVVNGPASGESYGIANLSFGNLKVQRTDVTLSGSSFGYGLFSRSANLTLEDSRINVGAGTKTYGYFSDPTQSDGALTVTESTIVAQGTSSETFGIRFNSSSSSMKVEHSRIEATSNGLSYGVDCFFLADCSIGHSEIAGATASVTGSLSVGATQLKGGAASGATCAGVYDESYTFYASTCP